MYISVAEASEKWGVSHRQVQRLLALGKIPWLMCAVAYNYLERAYEKIAEQNCISVGRLKNIMTGIYDKLLISNRSELSKFLIHLIHYA